MSYEQGNFKKQQSRRRARKENWYAKNRSMCVKREIKEEKSAKRAGCYNFGGSDKMEPQIGLESLSAATLAFESLSRFSNVNLPENVLREVEGMLLLILTLTQQTTEIGVTTTVLTWVQGRTSKSLFTTVKDYIMRLLITPQSNATPDWLDCMRDIRQNWQLCKSNRAFKQLSKLIGCLVSLGLCDVSSIPFGVSGYEMFSENLLSKHMGAFDIIDALFETVVYFTEGAYLCFQTNSLKPLLINDKTSMELDAEYAQVSSMFDLVKNGNLRKFQNVTDQEFETRMNRLSTSLQNLSTSLKGLDKKLVMDKYQSVLSMQNNYVAMKISSGIRHAPWAIQLFGESSQGKTTMADQLLDAVLFSQNMATGREYRCSYNPSDKFMSNWKSDKLVMIFDDISNEKSNFVERPPTRAILDVINNQAYYANKAELDAKGKCFVEPWIVCATTNRKDLDAGYYSNCPYSIQRRLISITVRAKTQFQRIEGGVSCGIDPSKVRALYTDSEGNQRLPLFDDIWELDIEKAVKPKRLDLVATYKPIVWRGKEMVNVSMKECIQWAIEDFDEHIKNQEALMNGMRIRDTCLQLCDHDGCRHLKGNCPIHTDFIMEPHFGLETVGAFRRLWYDGSKSRIDSLFDRADKDFADSVYSSGINFLSAMNWVKALPHDYLYDSRVCKLVLWFSDDVVNYKYWWLKLINYSMCSILILITLFVLPLILWPLSFYFIRRWYRRMNIILYSCAEYTTLRRLRRLNFAVTPIVRRYRDTYMAEICKASIGIAALYGIARAYRAYKLNQQNSQGSLEPITKAEIDARDGEKNIWTSVVKRDLPISETSRRMSPEQLANVLRKSLLYVTIHAKENGMANCLALSSNVILLPHHYFLHYGDTMECTFRRNNPESSGGKFTARLDIDYSYLLPNSDMRVCYIPNGGSFKNLVNLFPTQEMPSVPFNLMWRDKAGEIHQGSGISQPGVQTTYRDFVGGSYRNFNALTFNGMCGAVLHSHTNGSTILGIHVGGTTGTPIGVYNSILQQDLHHAFAYLRSKEGVILSGSAGKFETIVLDTHILKSDELHTKSPLNYMPQNSQVMYHGSCVGRTVNKSSVTVTPISPLIMEICGVPNIYGGPKFKPDWFGWQECLGNLSIPALPYPVKLLEKAIVDYKSALLPIFSSNLWKDTRPLDDKSNVCGIPGRRFIDPIKSNTSIGYPLSGPKSHFMVDLEPTEEHPNNRDFIDEIKSEINRLEDCYKKGERGYPIAKACKKDEILAKEKCRIFYSNSISLTFLIRKYYLPILRVLQMNPLKSECAVGINAYSPEWDRFYKHATRFGEDRLIGGDYGKYDQKLPAQVILASLRILIDFAKQCDYSQADLDIMEALCGDIVFAYIAFNGDLISLTEGTHISGNSLTVIINGICGSLNMRCYYYSQQERTAPFRDCISLMTYGDDNIGSVDENVHDFTIKGCSEFLASYGQVYTMPDKESELLDFLPIEDFEFLKRKNIWHEELECNVGALVDKSIYKSLHCVLREKNSPITMEQACAINIDGALREWFNHGRDTYENRRELMNRVAREAGISYMCDELDVTYDDRVCAWKGQYSQGIEVQCSSIRGRKIRPSSGSEGKQNPPTVWSPCEQVIDAQSGFQWRRGPNGTTASWFTLPRSHKAHMITIMRDLQKLVGNCIKQKMKQNAILSEVASPKGVGSDTNESGEIEASQTTKLTDFIESREDRHCFVDQSEDSLQEDDICGESLSNYYYTGDPYFVTDTLDSQSIGIAPQSGKETYSDGRNKDSTIVRLGDNPAYENVKFADHHADFKMDMSGYMDPTRSLQDSSDAELGNFFSRPIKIQEFQWQQATDISAIFDPWALYFGNPRVSNRISNYNLLRCKLHVKVLVNGNGFFYGRALMSYLPFYDVDEASDPIVTNSQQLVSVSQRPHIFLDPTRSQGGEMVLPFFWHKNNICIPNGEWTGMGLLNIASLNSLKHANASTDTVTISVFAWAEDVNLSILTTDEASGLTPQSGNEIDEANSKGFISGPATSVARMASALRDVPVIAPYARATESAASTTASVAKLLGFSRPPQTANPDPYKPVTTSSLAVTTVPDGVQKLTIDDKQELTIDPRVAGLGPSDPLNIKEIAKRESFLTTFQWSPNDAPETLLFNSRVDPVMFAKDTNPASPGYYFTASAMAAIPFKFWSGSMRFRFQFVGSSFHKGRVKIVFDPNSLLTDEYNTNYMHVVDISEKSDFSIEITNGQSKSILTHAKASEVEPADMYSGTRLVRRETYGNGVVGVYVVNQLTVPNSTIDNSIGVNVFVSMGDDFEVYVPDDDFQVFTSKPLGVVPQSGTETMSVPESHNTVEPSAPQHEDAEALGPTRSDNSSLSMVYMGESIYSFRSLLKRYNLWSSIGTLANNSRVLYGVRTMFPFFRGSVPGAVHTTSLGIPYNYCNTILLHWIVLAHSGWRGSIRYKFAPRGAIDADAPVSMYVQRLGCDSIAYSTRSIAAPTYTTAEQVAASGVVVAGNEPKDGQPFSGVKGQAYQNGSVNSTLEFEMPFYSNDRFVPGKRLNYTSDAERGYERFGYYVAADGLTSSVIDMHVAAGEDFTPLFFTGLPVMYKETNAPAP